MNNSIYFEDLVANALILDGEYRHKRVVSLSELHDYGDRIKKWWKDNKNIDVCILESKYYIDLLFSEYPSYFAREIDKNGELAISLVKGVCTKDLRQKFRPYLSVDMLLSFIESYTKG